MKGWLYEHIGHYCHAPLANDIETVNYIYSVVVSINSPDAIVNQLFALVGNSKLRRERGMVC